MSEYILEMHEVTKDFPGVRALENVSLNVRKGEIYSICGENGAGKSTLMSIISGVFPKGTYEGKIILKGKETHYHSVKDSERDGLAIIHQELALSPYLPIYENIFLGHMKTNFGIINWNYYIKESQKYLQRVGLKENPATIVSKIGVGKQQLVEIARALSKKAEILILDEPTSSLNDEDSEKLLQLIIELKNHGITCIMISHKLNEILEIADRVSVLRDGKLISTYDVKNDNIHEAQLIKDMVGRDLTTRFPERKTTPGEVVMEVKNWSVYHPDYHSIKVIDDASFYVRSGEIVAFCGPMGAGRTELMMSIYGKSYGSRSEGELSLFGKKVELHSPREAIAAGLGYLSEDRKNLGLILIQDVKTNISLSSLQKLSHLGIVDGQQEITEAERFKEELQIKTPSIMQLTRNLSGGNQQKVILGKWMMKHPKILFMDEPTRGIDVGTKASFYKMMGELVSSGISIILVSSDMPELVSMSDRCIILCDGVITAELQKD